MAIKVGVLVPKSLIYPTYGLEFVNGLRMAVADAPDIELVIEIVNFAEKGEMIMEKAQKLMFEHQLSAFVCLGGKVIKETMINLSESAQIPVIIGDTGANIHYMDKTPWLFNNSLDIWKSTWLLGLHVLEEGHQKIGAISSFYDAGYQMLYAFVEGTNTQQNIPVFTIVSPYDPDPNEPTLFHKNCEDNKPEAIFAALSHDYAKNFLNYFSNNEHFNQLPIYANLHTGSRDVLEQLDQDISIMNIASWVSELENESNQQFVKQYEATYHRTATASSVLGYENGMALKLAIAATEKDHPSGKEIAETLATISFDGPRSRFSFDKERHTYNTEHWLIETSYKDKNYNNRIIKQIDIKEDLLHELIEKTKSLTDSGWLNPYLCI